MLVLFRGLKFSSAISEVVDGNLQGTRQQCVSAVPGDDEFTSLAQCREYMAANYFRGEITAGIDDATLKTIVNFLLTGTNPPWSGSVDP